LLWGDVLYWLHTEWFDMEGGNSIEGPPMTASLILWIWSEFWHLQHAQFWLNHDMQSPVMKTGHISLSTLKNTGTFCQPCSVAVINRYASYNSFKCMDFSCCFGLEVAQCQLVASRVKK
jgi:hypothetical protein